MGPCVVDRERRGVAISGDQAAAEGTERQQRRTEFAGGGQKFPGCHGRKNGHRRLYVRDRRCLSGPPQHLGVARAQADLRHLAYFNQVGQSRHGDLDGDVRVNPVEQQDVQSFTSKTA